MAVLDGGFNPWNLVQVLWGFLLGVLIWIARKVIGDVEKLKSGKADKDDISDRFDEVTRNQRTLSERFERAHEENTKRLVDIWRSLSKRHDDP